jgi:hypothetical protein
MCSACCVKPMVFDGRNTHTVLIRVVPTAHTTHFSLEKVRENKGKDNNMSGESPKYEGSCKTHSFANYRQSRV